MSTPTRDEILFAAGGDVWTKYGTFVRRTLPGEERGTHSRSDIGTFRDRSLNMREAESGVFRPTWVDGESMYAARLEASRTNELTRSEALGHADWTTINCSVTADQSTGPDGATSLDEIVEDSTDAGHGVEQTVTGMTANADYALSCWAVANTRDLVLLRLLDSGSTTNRVSAWFDVSTGAVGTTQDNGTGTFVRAYVEDWTDTVSGLYRIVLVGSVGNSATSIIGRVEISSVDGQTSYQGDGSSSLYAGYTQFENSSSVASSYRSTTDSSSGRTADNLTVDFPHTPQAMTVYVKHQERGTLLEGEGGKLLNIGGPSHTDDPRFTVGESGDNYQVGHDNGSTLAAATLTSAPSLHDIVEVRAVLKADGSVEIGQSIGGGSEATAQDTTTADLGDVWSENTLAINSAPNGNRPGFNDFMSFIVASGDRTMQEMRDIEL